jgi:RNA polymerase sigma-70 factor (ECF subfamily)
MTESKQPLFTEESGARDAELVARVLAGDADAFGRLIAPYERPAVSTAYRLLGNSDDARDVTQEAFLRAYRSLARLQDPTRFGPWLLRIVSNLSLNARRSRKSAASFTLDEARGTEGATTGEGEPVVTAFSPDRHAESRELQQALDAALARLPEKQRMALVLFTIEGWAQKDIAELLECSLETVKWNVFQARKRLKEMLGEMLIE